MPISYKKKTRIIPRNSKDPFYNDFFNEKDAQHIINALFINLPEIDVNLLLTRLNEATFIFGNYNPDATNLHPGKTDEKRLFKELFKIGESYSLLVNTLLIDYGKETLRHAEPYLNTPRQIFTDIRNAIKSINHSLPAIIGDIEKTKGKKRGGNIKKSITNFIYNLAKIYKEITGKNAEDNFISPKAHTLSYRGEFYQFVHTVFNVINSNFSKRYEKSLRNPFSIILADKSQALGKQIKKVFKKINTMPQENA